MQLDSCVDLPSDVGLEGCITMALSVILFGCCAGDDKHGGLMICAVGGGIF